MNKNIHIVIIVILIVLLALLFMSNKKGNESESELESLQESQTSQPRNTATTADSNGTNIVDTTISVETGTAKKFTVTGSNFAFDPKGLSVKKGDTVSITFVNKDGLHDLKIDEFGVATKQISANQEETVTFVANKTGKFQYYCSVGKHREMGMWGTLTVTE